MVSFPKPAQKRKLAKAAQDRAKGRSRRQCVEIVWARDKHRCVRCGRKVRRHTECYGWEDDRGDVHEIVPRSLMGDPTDPNNCQLLCKSCHMSGPSGAHTPTADQGER